MKEHIEDILVGGRPMTKLEKANKEIERLNNIINKAIEYVEDENIDITTIRFNDIQDVKKELLDILKGEDNE